MDNKYLVEPFTQFDSAYLESLPDEVFFGKRFVMSEEDQALLMQNSSMVHGRRFLQSKGSRCLDGKVRGHDKSPGERARNERESSDSLRKRICL